MPKHWIEPDPFPSAPRVSPDALARSLTAIGKAAGTLKEDGWANAYTGVGTSRDKMAQAAYLPNLVLSPQQCSILFNSDDIARRVVCTRPEEMLRAGYRLITDDEDLTKELRLDAESLKLDEHLFHAMCWGKCFGGGVVLLGAMDGRTMDKPLDETKVRSIEWVTDLDRRFIYPEWAVKALTGKDIPPPGQLPETDIYQILSPVWGGMSRVHSSRIIRFDGELTDIHTRMGLHGWTLPTLQVVYEALQMFGMSFASVGHLLQDASQGVFKIKDMLHMIASNRQALLDRMALVDTSRSVARAILLDADAEDFTRVQTSFTSLPELLDRIMQRMSAACRVPVTLLMGRSAAGMNATGDSDFRAYYDSVGAEQKKILLPALLKVYRMLATTRGADPNQIRIEFNKLWEPTEQESSLTEKQDADRDVAYINAGVLTPEEVAMRIAKGSRKICDTEIDVEVRKKSLEIEHELMLDPESHKPVAPTLPGQEGEEQEAPEEGGDEET